MLPVFLVALLGILVFAVVAEAVAGDAGLYLTSFVGGLVSSKIVLVEFVNGEMRSSAMVPMAVIGAVGLAVFFLL